jgi:hypothetical protein
VIFVLWEIPAIVETLTPTRVRLPKLAPLTPGWNRLEEDGSYTPIDLEELPYCMTLDTEAVYDGG